MQRAEVKPGVLSRLFISKNCGQVWTLFGEHLYPCANAGPLLAKVQPA